MDEAAAPLAGAILRARAKALAEPAQAAAATGPVLELLEFRLAQEQYAMETRHVDQVVPLRDITPLPGTPAFLLGIVNVRGRILPVIDIRRFFDLPDQGLTDLHRIIMVRGVELEFGVLADAITGLRVVPLADLQASLPTFEGIRSDNLKGVIADRVVVLDFDRILADPRIIINQEEQE
jgi:purine-binding chemotaxis protein CheW